MNRTLFVPLVALVAHGCASPSDLTASSGSVAEPAPVCSSADECDAMWRAARDWMIQFMDEPIRTYSPDYIETDPPGSAGGLAGRVTKDPIDGGQHRIVATVWCADVLGCLIPPDQAVAHFNKTLNALPQ